MTYQCTKCKEEGDKEQTFDSPTMLGTHIYNFHPAVAKTMIAESVYRKDYWMVVE